MKTQGSKQAPTEVPEGAVLSEEAGHYGWVERAAWTNRMLEALRRGGPEGGRWYWLHDKVFSVRNLRAAYARVARNGGAEGVDGRSVESFGERLGEEIERLMTAWKADEFRPQAIRRTWIPKPGTDEKRPLGIPTVRDRVVQTALVSVLEPIYENTFSDHSYGFRPGRSALDAMTAVEAHLKAGRLWVVDADLKAYFDNIPHERLMEKLRRKVTDKRVLGLIEQFLKAGVLDGKELIMPEAGTPQGGVLSPLLANVYLNDLDHLMDDSGVAMVRYADDFLLLCHTQEEAERALERVRGWTAEAGLTLHPTKTRVVDMGQPGAYIDFLGYRLQHHIDRKGRRRLLRLVRPTSHARVRDKLRTLTPRKSGIALKARIALLNEVLRGWFGYFRSVALPIHTNLDSFVRRRLRAMLCKWHRRKPQWVGGRVAEWWPNSFFTKQGLFSLAAAHAEFIQSHRGTRRLESRMRENRTYGSEGGVAG